MKLSELGINQKGVVEKINVQLDLKNRLLYMGLNKGSEVELIRYAPCGDPIQIKIRGFYLAIRKNVAEKIILK